MASIKGLINSSERFHFRGTQSGSLTDRWGAHPDRWPVSRLKFLGRVRIGSSFTGSRWKQHNGYWWTTLSGRAALRMSDRKEENCNSGLTRDRFWRGIRRRRRRGQVATYAQQVAAIRGAASG